MRHRLIYLDNSTTARPSEKSISAMMPFLNDMWGHTSAPHQKGQQLQAALKQNFKILHDFIGAEEADSIVFTSSGTEAVNQAIQSVYQTVTIPTGKNHFITSILDEAASIRAIHRLESLGCVGKMIPASKEGFVTAKDLAETITPRTALVSLSWANGLTGVIQPLEEIAELCKQRGILLHLDATHVLGKLVYDLKNTGADFISFNGDPLHACKGTGCLYIRQGVKCTSLLMGGFEQDGLRGGIINMAGLASLAAAAQEATESRDYLCTEIARLRDRLEEGVIQGFPKSQVLFKNQERLPHCTTLVFPGMINEALLFLISRKGVCATMGGNDFQQLGLLLSATGINEMTAHSALSFSLSRYTTEEEIEQASAIIVESALILEKISSKIMSEA